MPIKSCTICFINFGVNFYTNSPDQCSDLNDFHYYNAFSENYTQYAEGKRY